MQPIQNAGNARLFARNLRFRRIAAGASQRKMAAVLGVSRSRRLFSHQHGATLFRGGNTHE